MLWRHIGQEGLSRVSIVTAHVQHRHVCPHGTSTQLGVSSMHTAHTSPLEWETDDADDPTRPSRGPRAAGGATLLMVAGGATLNMISSGAILLRVAGGATFHMVSSGETLLRVAGGEILLRVSSGETLLRVSSGETLLVTSAIRYTAWLSNDCDKWKQKTVSKLIFCY